MEIERKFLVKVLPNDLESYECINVTQAYISTDPVIRLRNSNDEKYVLTLKSKGHLVREEIEFPLTKEQFLNLWSKIETKVVTKKRYLIPLGGNLIAELDIYSDYLDGLTTVEVEFPSAVEAENFCPPSWFGQDVTHDSRYKNSSLSLYGVPSI